ncbi:MAG: bacillithiol biosynthesis deacetylase BshB1 [Vulcanimicrobiota bacterium]
MTDKKVEKKEEKPRSEDFNGTIDMLCFGAHPDDCELMAGGTIIKTIQNGYKVGIVDMTRGEMGTRGSVEIRQKEADCASCKMGVVHRENLDIPDTMVLPTLENRNKIIEVIRRLKPTVVMAPWIEQRHPDHNHASDLVREACFFSGLRKYPLEQEPHRPRKIIYYLPYTWNVEPSFFVDITGQFEMKLQVIQCYHSQFIDIKATLHFSPYVEGLLERIRHYNGFYGRAARVKYAEGFMMREPRLVNNVMEIDVPSY